MIMLMIVVLFQPNMLMPVIKYCLNSEDHVLKKLLYVFWESVDKTDSKGTLLPEMILVWYTSHQRHCSMQSRIPPHH